MSTFNCLDNSLLQSNNLTNITSLKLPLANIKHSARDYIILILGAFPNLHALQLDGINKIQVDEILMQKLLTSALTELSLRIDEFTLSANARNFNDFRSNRTLEILKLRCKPTKDGDHESLFSMMVQNFQNIRQLTIHFPSDKIMEGIFKYQVSKLIALAI